MAKWQAEKTTLLRLITLRAERIKKLKLECGQQATKICVLNLRIEELEAGLILIRKSTEIMEARRFAEQALEGKGYETQ